MLIKVGVGGVDLSGLHLKIWDAIKIVKEIWGEEEIIITSTWESADHLDYSKHYQKKAIDLRRPSQAEKVSELQKKFVTKKGYDLIVRKKYIHIEWDPKESHI